MSLKSLLRLTIGCAISFSFALAHARENASTAKFIKNVNKSTSCNRLLTLRSGDASVDQLAALTSGKGLNFRARSENDSIEITVSNNRLSVREGRSRIYFNNDQWGFSEDIHGNLYLVMGKGSGSRAKSMAYFFSIKGERPSRPSGLTLKPLFEDGGMSSTLRNTPLDLDFLAINGAQTHVHFTTDNYTLSEDQAIAHLTSLREGLRAHGSR